MIRAFVIVVAVVALFYRVLPAASAGLGWDPIVLPLAVFGLGLAALLGFATWVERP